MPIRNVENSKIQIDLSRLDTGIYSLGLTNGNREMGSGYNYEATIEVFPDHSINHSNTPAPGSTTFQFPAAIVFYVLPCLQPGPAVFGPNQNISIAGVQNTSR